MKTKMWTLMAGIAISALAHGASAPAQAGPIDLAVSTSPYDNAVPEIRVDGPTATGGYTEVTTKTLDYIVSVRGDRPKRPKGGGYFWVDFGSDLVDGKISGDWTNYKLSTPYVDPRSPQVVNDRISPIDTCNQNLALKTKNGMGEEFRKKGLAFIHYDAYEMKGHVSYGNNTATQAARNFNRSILVPVSIKCMPLDRPRPRENSGTKGPPPREGKQMAPTIKQATLRIAPAHVVQDGKFLCPSELKLHGYLETIREFHGKSIFVGPHYLSAMTALDLQAAGSRNVTATYKMDWHQMGGLTTKPNAEPKKQKLTFHFNISDKDGKLLKSLEETVEVSCKKVKVNGPTAGDGMTVNPAN